MKTLGKKKTKELRKLAEDVLKNQPLSSKDLSHKETDKLIHELQVHQIELEMQNDELQKTQVLLEKSRTKYSDLYDFAPVSYLTVSEQGIIQQANLTSSIMLGEDRDKLLHQPLTSFIAREDQDIYYLHRKLLFDTHEPQDCDLRMEKRDGSQFYAHLQGVIGSDDQGKTNCKITISDISRLKQAEEKIKKSLEENQVLLKEVYHRIKNNLATIVGLLNLQLSQIKDPQSHSAFIETKDRIHSMALVHQQLYQSEDLTNINFKEYIKNLVTDLFHASQISKNVKLQFELEEVTLSLDTAIPCGLILNELVTNVFKHAFPNNQKGTTQIIMRLHKDNIYELIVKDDGIGIPKNINIEKADSLGLKLIYMLTKQLDGELKINSKNGSEFSIQFRIE
jgi:two-component system, sensor histidine kinase PdtaS